MSSVSTAVNSSSIFTANNYNSSLQSQQQTPQQPVDQRLNPAMLGERRISDGSLADEQDYSRKILRVANPDD